MRIPAASCSSVHELVTGPRQPLTWLGACASALYLATDADDVVAVLTHDAVRLPCSLVLPWRADERPLTAFFADGTDRPPATVGDGTVTWGNGTAGVGSGMAEIAIVAARQWRPPPLRTGTPRPDTLRELASALRDRVPAVLPAGIHVADLLGRGPGLTPSGDDVLAGYLVGARAFGMPCQSVADEIAGNARTRTTTLSAQLLRHAAAGECVPQLVRLVDACLGRADLDGALGAVFAVGHTSGAALAAGVLIAGQAAVELVVAA